MIPFWFSSTGARQRTWRHTLRYVDRAHVGDEDVEWGWCWLWRWWWWWWWLWCRWSESPELSWSWRAQRRHLWAHQGLQKLLLNFPRRNSTKDNISRHCLYVSPTLTVIFRDRDKRDHNSYYASYVDSKTFAKVKNYLHKFVSFWTDNLRQSLVTRINMTSCTLITVQHRRRKKVRKKEKVQWNEKKCSGTYLSTMLPGLLSSESNLFWKAKEQACRSWFNRTYPGNRRTSQIIKKFHLWSSFWSEVEQIVW